MLSISSSCRAHRTLTGRKQDGRRKYINQNDWHFILRGLPPPVLLTGIQRRQPTLTAAQWWTPHTGLRSLPRKAPPLRLCGRLRERQSCRGWLSILPCPLGSRSSSVTRRSGTMSQCHCSTCIRRHRPHMQRRHHLPIRRVETAVCRLGLSPTENVARFRRLGHGGTRTLQTRPSHQNCPSAPPPGWPCVGSSLSALRTKLTRALFGAGIFLSTIRSTIVVVGNDCLSLSGTPPSVWRMVMTHRRGCRDVIGRNRLCIHESSVQGNWMACWTIG